MVPGSPMFPIGLQFPGEILKKAGLPPGAWHWYLSVYGTGIYPYGTIDPLDPPSSELDISVALFVPPLGLLLHSNNRKLVTHN
jgi:hypothetical protein